VWSTLAWTSLYWGVPGLPAGWSSWQLFFVSWIFYQGGRLEFTPTQRRVALLWDKWLFYLCLHFFLVFSTCLVTFLDHFDSKAVHVWLQIIIYSKHVVFLGYPFCVSFFAFACLLLMLLLFIVDALPARATYVLFLWYSLGVRRHLSHSLPIGCPLPWLPFPRCWASLHSSKGPVSGSFPWWCPPCTSDILLMDLQHVNIPN
jgi:hypothetical protein